MFRKMIGKFTVLMNILFLEFVVSKQKLIKNLWQNFPLNLYKIKENTFREPTKIECECENRLDCSTLLTL